VRIIKECSLGLVTKNQVPAGRCECWSTESRSTTWVPVLVPIAGQQHSPLSHAYGERSYPQPRSAVLTYITHYTGRQWGQVSSVVETWKRARMLTPA
jgi:hypothetical protein